ncbi:MAG: hypothetical protein Q8L41_08900 [Anaerolineales bacterium]|nr:hypothetical protein [Anaerolineales bacterium]
MKPLNQFLSLLPKKVQQKIARIKSPFDAQEYLYSMPYNAEARDRSPLNVMLDQQCHCLDGGFLAALLLWKIGFTPLVLDLLPAPESDDDHVLALYQVEGRWGATAKSNFVQLGFREPAYRDLRELAMSYFEHYMNTHRQKTLRRFTRPMNLSKLDPSWMWDEASAHRLYTKFYTRKSIPLISKSTEKKLNLVRPDIFNAETLGTDMNWVYGNREK